jgi:hypothetical protein
MERKKGGKEEEEISEKYCLTTSAPYLWERIKKKGLLYLESTRKA